MTIGGLSIDAMAAAYRAGTTTPVAVVGEIIRRIAQAKAVDPAIWISLRDEAELLAEAAALGDGRAPVADKPLWGIPFAVKDNIDAAGLPTTAACPQFAYMPAANSPVVRRLREAGALLIGKTNLDQFATGLVGVRSPYGAPRSPFDTDYISGGSSSGSAVAVARGLVSFALGTDTAGSGRVPAAMNNIVGLKPTKGLLSTSGMVPACRSLDCVSVFALTADDCATVLALTAAPDAGDAYSRAAPVALGSTLPVAPAACRMGIPLPAQRIFCGDVDAAAIYEAALRRAEVLGASLVEIDFEPFFDVARMLYETAFVAERTAAVGEFLAAHPMVGDPTVRRLIEGGAGFSAAETFTALHRLEALRARCAPIWDGVDVLLVPTAPTTYRVAAIEADPVRLNTTLGTYTNFVNLLDLAAVAVPAGFSAAGLPHGVTLIGPAFSDLALLSLGDALHRGATTTAGATGLALPAARRRAGGWTTATAKPGAASPGPAWVKLAVVGAHMQGMPLNHELTEIGGRFAACAETAPLYALYALPGAGVERPGMVRVVDGAGAAVALEVWELPSASVGGFLGRLVAPLTIGPITLADGSEVLGFLCEAAGASGATDITAWGGWRGYMAQRGR